MSDSPTTVCVVDDDASVRKALERLLKSAGFEVRTFKTAQEFLDQTLPAGPACAVLDVRLPGLSGLDVQAALAERHANVPLIFITGHGDIPMTVRAMKAGAVDFLPKPFDNRALLSAVRQAIVRDSHTRQADAGVASVRARLGTLSPREREVMGLVVKGLLNKQVGHQLGVSEKTVKVHRAHAMQKMGARSFADLVRMAEKL
jgi:FixJ family two-component response regulator